MTALKDRFFVDLLMPSLYTKTSFPAWIKILSILAAGVISIIALVRCARTLRETKYYSKFFVLLLLSLSATIQFFANIIPFRWNPRTALLFSNAFPHLFLGFALYINQNNPMLIRGREAQLGRRLKITLFLSSLALLGTFLLSLIIIFQDVELILPNSSSEGTSINNILTLISFPQKTVLLVGLTASVCILNRNNLQPVTRYFRHLTLLGICLLELIIRIALIDLFKFGPHFVSLLWHEYQRGSAISSSWMNLADFVIFQLFSIIILLLPEKKESKRKNFWLMADQTEANSYNTELSTTDTNDSLPGFTPNVDPLPENSTQYNSYYDTYSD
ncbi:hypothetical protein BLNAU_15821 [Blattamonas nauphoetae]|uniref:Integral membrane protein n=1 Tax=Blattamonas nauphoetae TaxID=2049346 RepID=A0ABQ9XD82_9EUKA|nr:hypothetical protein BLNAU_15821 [Blattamonas nauphoetae]